MSLSRRPLRHLSLCRALSLLASSARLPSLSRRAFSSADSVEDDGSDADFRASFRSVGGQDQSQEVQRLIRKDISENRVFLYMKGHPEAPQCGFSNQVVQILRREGARFSSRNVLENSDVREGIKRFSNWPTIPQLYVDGEFVGGCDIVTQLWKSGELKEILASKSELEAQDSVAQMIEKDIRENRVFLYMKGNPDAPQCGFSNQVVQILKKEGIQFSARNVLEDAELREGVKKFSNWPTIPQLYIDGEFVGGCDIVTQMWRSGELSQMLGTHK